jgi:hypothetical protein
MKIILFGFDSKRLFPEETPREEINGVHTCMSGAKYIVDINEETLTYIGGLSPMFVHEDFPVGTGLEPTETAMELLKGISGFEVEYSDSTCPKFTKRTIRINYEDVDLEELIKFAKHCRRIEPNSWEIAGKFTILNILASAFARYADGY